LTDFVNTKVADIFNKAWILFIKCCCTSGEMLLAEIPSQSPIHKSDLVKFALPFFKAISSTSTLPTKQLVLDLDIGSHKRIVPQPETKPQTNPQPQTSYYSPQASPPRAPSPSHLNLSAEENKDGHTKDETGKVLKRDEETVVYLLQLLLAILQQGVDTTGQVRIDLFGVIANPTNNKSTSTASNPLMVAVASEDGTNKHRAMSVAVLAFLFRMSILHADNYIPIALLQSFLERCPSSLLGTMIKLASDLVMISVMPCTPTSNAERVTSLVYRLSMSLSDKVSLHLKELVSPPANPSTMLKPKTCQPEQKNTKDPKDNHMPIYKRHPFSKSRGLLPNVMSLIMNEF
jgi:hypothetical protein